MNPLLDVPAALEYLGGIGRTTLYLLVTEGEINRVKIRGRSFITRASLDAYIDRLLEKEVY